MSTWTDPLPDEPPVETEYIGEWEPDQASDPTPAGPPLPHVAQPGEVPGFQGCRASTLAGLVEPMAERLEIAARYPGAGIETTGLGPLDEVVRVTPGDVVVIGGREGAGKSALALQVARWMAGRGPVLYVLTEMTLESVAERLVAQAAHIDLWKLQRSPSTEQRRQAREAMVWLAEHADLTIVEPTGEPWTVLRKRINAWAAAHRAEGRHPRAVFIDNLWGLSHGSRVDGDSAQVSRRLGGIVSELTHLAKPGEVDAPVFLVHHLNRGAAPGAPGGRPETANLGGSDHIGYWASSVWLLAKNRDDTEASHTLTVSKNRTGRNDVDLPVEFVGAQMRFVAAGPGEDAPRPFATPEAPDTAAEAAVRSLRSRFANQERSSE
jgi:replicative DNA helicase